MENSYRDPDDKIPPTHGRSTFMDKIKAKLTIVLEKLTIKSSSLLLFVMVAIFSSLFFGKEVFYIIFMIASVVELLIVMIIGVAVRAENDNIILDKYPGWTGMTIVSLIMFITLCLTSDYFIEPSSDKHTFIQMEKSQTKDVCVVFATHTDSKTLYDNVYVDSENSLIAHPRDMDTRNAGKTVDSIPDNVSCKELWDDSSASDNGDGDGDGDGE